jgi:lysophospholipase L1-like esterase
LTAGLLLAVCSVVVLLLVIELGARIIGLDGDLALMPHPSNCQRRDALLGYAFRANCEAVLEGTPFSTNSLGLRSPEVRADGSVRVLALGDSCTWGWAVGQDQSYPAELQRRLDERDPAARFQVINAGVPGYTSYQGLEYLRNRGLALDPAIVIIAYGFNDLFETGDIEEQLRTLRASPRLFWIESNLQQVSSFYRWMRWRADAVPKGSSVRVTVEKHRRNLDEMIRLARAHGADVILLSFWSPQQPQFPYRTAVLSLARDWNVPLIEYDGDRLDVVHPTAEGYRLLGARISSQILDQPR